MDNMAMLWDIFCRVIDNHGDIGVCWRLSADLADRGHDVRLWVDDRSALEWMAPGALRGLWPQIKVLHWEQCMGIDTLHQLPIADVWIEAFGCEIPTPFVSHFVRALGVQHDGSQNGAAVRPTWINLEYLSAEPYVERSHALPSPVTHGPAKGWIKYFYYPGFTPRTGGLLREPHTGVQPLPDMTRSGLLSRFGIKHCNAFIVSLFCYEPPLLKQLLSFLAEANQPTRLLITHGRASAAVRALWGSDSTHGNLQLTYLPHLSQSDFDTLLQSCDLNFVRGEDSVLRALWAGKPFVWQIYAQNDNAHVPKLHAFMYQMRWSSQVQNLHLGWNGLLDDHQAVESLQVLQPGERAPWQSQVTATRARLLEMSDLVTQLLQFIQKNR